MVGQVGYVGIDIQRINELFPDGLPIGPKSDPELTSIFTMIELSYAQTKNNPIETLTGIFCVKEAIIKCSNINLKFTDIQVLNDKDNKPTVAGYLISISHSSEFLIAIAVSMLLKGNDKENLTKGDQLEEKIKKLERRQQVLFIELIGVASFIALVYK